MNSKTNFLYYTSTGQKLFMRVRVDPQTDDPEGTPELVDSGTMADDFCIDEDAGVAYVTTHRENTIDRVLLEPNGGSRRSVAGKPFNELLLGPSSAAWSRAPGEYGRVGHAAQWTSTQSLLGVAIGRSDDCVGFSTNRNASAGNTCTVPRHGKHLAGAQEPAPLPFAHVDR